MVEKQSAQNGCRELADLLKGVEFRLHNKSRLSGREIGSITVDSRQVDQSTLFVALIGTVTDGHRYIGDVLRAGCQVLVVEEGWQPGELIDLARVCCLVVPDSHKALGQLAAAFYGHPAGKLSLIGVTGTNGKTSVTYLLENIFRVEGHRVGVIGTVNYRYQDREGNQVEIPATLTTPDSLVLQKLLGRMVMAGVEVVLMEVSSHALAQRRLDGIDFDCGAFTNLSHDHLDYHQTMDNYFQVKSRLLTNYLKPGGQAVVCSGVGRTRDQWAGQMIDLCARKGINALECGDNSDSHVRLIGVDHQPDGSVLSLEVGGQPLKLNSSLVGSFNSENLLTAFGVGLAVGLDQGTIAEGLSGVTGVPGRLQRIKGCDSGAQPIVFVDYAHTPDALEKVLRTLTDLPHGRLITVFGCGGDRDRAKRPLMGEIAGRYSDLVLVTDDNPRTEKPEKIIAEIRDGLDRAGMPACTEKGLEEGSVDKPGYCILRERQRAISLAVRLGRQGDIVLIAGKGHENYQLTRDGKRFFDDALQVRENLCSWTVSRVCAAVGGKMFTAVTDLDRPLGKVSTNSRGLTTGDIFVALEGETFNGHDFLHQAVGARCGCLVVSQPVGADVVAGVPVVTVKDTLQGLGDLAAWRRRAIRKVSCLKVIGITGSCGKTTVKEMVAAILNRLWPDGEDVPSQRVLKTKGNFNNLIGLPLSLLPIGVKEKVAVLEMGMNQPGEIARLTEISDPDVACITNVHPAHLLGLHTIEGVAGAKEELFAGCREDSVLVINLDDPHISRFAEQYGQKKICFSVAETAEAQGAQVWATEITLVDDGCARFTLHLEERKSPVVLRLAGLHNVANGLAAAAVTSAVGASIEAIVAGLQDVESVDKRMETLLGAAGCSILNDTYNANPASMRAGLTTLGQLAAGRRVAILGDMLELGESADQAHYEIGCWAARQKIDQLIVVGEFSDRVGAGALAQGMGRDQVITFAVRDELMEWLDQSGICHQLGTGDWLLVKGSRGMELETVVDFFINDN